MIVAAGVRIKFIEGDSIVFKFTELGSAMDFYRRAQRRNDALTVQFLDGDLHFRPEQGYGEIDRLRSD